MCEMTKYKKYILKSLKSQNYSSNIEVMINLNTYLK